MAIKPIFGRVILAIWRACTPCPQPLNRLPPRSSDGGAGNCVVRSTRFCRGRLEAVVVLIRLGSPRPRDSDARADAIKRESVKVFGMFRHLGVA